MERHELEAFLTLAEELHFGRTAERLHLSTARVGQTLKKLEREIGAPLFERTSRRVDLTPIGRQLHEDLRPLHVAMQHAVNRAVEAARGVRGALRVGFLDAALGHVVANRAQDFRARYPACEILLRETRLHDLFGALRADHVDLLATRLPVHEDDLTVGPVFLSEPTMMAVSACHAFAHRDALRLDDLADDAVLNIAGVPDYWREYHAPAQSSDGRPVPCGPSVSTFEEALALVSAGHGMCPVGAQAVRYYQRPDITYVPVADAPYHEFGLVWPTARETQRLRAFVEVVEQHAARSDGNSMSATEEFMSSP